MAYFGTQGNMRHGYVDTSKPLYGLGGDVGFENTSGWGKVFPARGTGEYELRGMGEYELRGLGTDPHLQPSVMSPDNINTLMPEFWMPAEVDHISFTYPGKEVRNEGRTFWTLGVPPPAFGYDPADVAQGFGCSKRILPEAAGGVPLGKCLDQWAVKEGCFVAAVMGATTCDNGGWQITKVPVAQGALLRRDAYGPGVAFKPYLLTLPGLLYPTQSNWANYILAVTGLSQGTGTLPGGVPAKDATMGAGMAGGAGKWVPVIVAGVVLYLILALRVCVVLETPHAPFLPPPRPSR